MSKIALLNDAFRTTPTGGTVLLSAGVYELPDMVKAAAIRKVVSYDDFNEDNDPHGEHDFGKFELCNRRFFWKIDYFDERPQTAALLPTRRRLRNVMYGSAHFANFNRARDIPVTVISGYLIPGLLLYQVGCGQFSLLSFYARPS